MKKELCNPTVGKCLNCRDEYNTIERQLLQ